MQPRSPRQLVARLTPAATIVITALLAPVTVLGHIAGHTRAHMTRLRDDEAGVSELAVVALLTGLAALAVVAYMVIVRGKVTDEANNLPTSG